MTNIVILLAAGHGSRINLLTPKQFLKIKNKELFRYSLDTFLNNQDIDLVVLCINKNHIKLWNPFLQEYSDPRLLFCFGGDDRLESFKLSMKFLDKFNFKPETKIITHDIARPFVSKEIIFQHIKLLDNHPVVNTIIPITDSLVSLNDNQEIVKYLKREQSFKVQTPQSFTYGSFSNINWSLIRENEVTDICFLFFINNVKIYNLIGSKDNIKITDKYDLNLFS